MRDKSNLIYLVIFIIKQQHRSLSNEFYSLFLCVLPHAHQLYKQILGWCCWNSPTAVLFIVSPQLNKYCQIDKNLCIYNNISPKYHLKYKDTEADTFVDGCWYFVSLQIHGPVDDWRQRWQAGVTSSCKKLNVQFAGYWLRRFKKYWSGQVLLWQSSQSQM